MSKWNSSTELVIGNDTSDFSALAEQLGMTPPSVKQKSTLARLKIDHQGIKGEAEVKGKKKQVFLVDAGSFVLEQSDGSKVYSEAPLVRVFLQKFMYQKYLSDDNKYVKTVMVNESSLNSELPDTEGGFNCGRKGGYIKDFDNLPQDTKDLLRNIKRVRVLFGEITMTDPMDENGQDLTDQIPDSIPFIWDIHNKEAYASVGEVMKTFYEAKELPFNRMIGLDVEERTLATGGKFYIPTFELDKKKLPYQGEKDPVHELYKNFAEFINVNNNYVEKEHQANKGGLPNGTVADVIDITGNLAELQAEKTPVKKINKKKKTVAELENKEDVTADLISTWGKKEPSTVDDGDG